jgi:hypothetical protein
MFHRINAIPHREDAKLAKISIYALAFFASPGPPRAGIAVRMRFSQPSRYNAENTE